MAHVLDAVFDEAVRLSVLAEGRHQELVRNFVTKEKLSTMEQKLQSIDTAVQGYQPAKAREGVAQPPDSWTATAHERK